MKTQLTEIIGTVEGMQDALVTDLKGIISETDKLLNEVACATAGDFAVARNEIAERLDDARSRLDSACMSVRKKADCAAHEAHDYVTDNPWTAVGIAATAGIIAGLLVWRR